MKLLNFHLKTQTFIWYTIHPIWDFSYVLMAAHCEEAIFDNSNKVEIAILLSLVIFGSSRGFFKG